MEPKQVQLASDVTAVAKALCVLDDVQHWVGLKNWLAMFTELPVSDRLGVELGDVVAIRKRYEKLAEAKTWIAFAIGVQLVELAKGIARDVQVQKRGPKTNRIRDAYDSIGYDKIPIQELADRFGLSLPVFNQHKRFDPDEFKDRGKVKSKTINGVRYIYRQRKDDGR